MDNLIVIKPRVSEKTYRLSGERRNYAVEVPSDANKTTVAQAISSRYGVTVETVNIVNVKGKVKRTVRKGGRPGFGRRSDMKKAYVTLKAGDTLPFYAAVDEPAKDAEKKSEKQSREEKK